MLKSEIIEHLDANYEDGDEVDIDIPAQDLTDPQRH